MLLRLFSLSDAKLKNAETMINMPLLATKPERSAIIAGYTRQKFPHSLGRENIFGVKETVSLVRETDFLVRKNFSGVSKTDFSVKEEFFKLIKRNSLEEKSFSEEGKTFQLEGK